MNRTIMDFIEEDVGYGDITTEAMGCSHTVYGDIIAKEPCVVAGLKEAACVFLQFDVKMEILIKDGERASSEYVVANVVGPANGVLTAERLALNFIMQMSGIATKTRRMVDIARTSNPKVKVAATRKTTPGFRKFQKRAVALGGGDTHRIRLDDMFLVKDNHIAAVGGISKALERVKEAHFSKKIEVEVTKQAEVEEAALAGAHILMLDNMGLDEVKQASLWIKEHAPGVLIEVSGRISEDNIAEYSPYADVISVGGLTHSFNSTDFSLVLKGP
ncbi:MAG TPA: carboxylating nicotinate-nucleotide diphosphorylase [Euryarchaeota archaeon]|nr:carboxylating nicotinate-nucleotide diphosphorylase [Euryarchaeota archaeon]